MVTVWGMFVLCGLVVGILNSNVCHESWDSQWLLWSHHEKLVCIPRVLDMLDLQLNCLSRKVGSFHKGTIAVSGLVLQAQSAGGNQMIEASFSLAQLLFLGPENAVAQPLCQGDPL